MKFSKPDKKTVWLIVLSILVLIQIPFSMISILSANFVWKGLEKFTKDEVETEKRLLVLEKFRSNTLEFQSAILNSNCVQNFEISILNNVTIDQARTNLVQCYETNIDEILKNIQSLKEINEEAFDKVQERLLGDYEK